MQPTRRRKAVRPSGHGKGKIGGDLEGEPIFPLPGHALWQDGQ